MSHVRTQIRDAVVNALSGNTSAGTRVFSSRIHPLDKGNTNGIAVYTLNESSGLATIGSIGAAQTYNRIVDVAIEAYSSSKTDLSDLLDVLSSEIEQAIESSASLRALVKQIELSRTEAQFAPNETSSGMIRLIYSITYRTRPTDPETSV